MIFLISVLPRLFVSRCVRFLMAVQRPKWFVRSVISFLINKYKINVSEAKKNLPDFNSVDEFFTREIKPELRPIQASFFVHPADSLIQAFGEIKKNQAYQIKDKPYLISDFFQDSKATAKLEDGFFITYYLSPQDYHRVHSPVAGKLKSSTFFPGDLWPVNQKSLQAVPELYMKNKRVLFEIETPVGKVFVAMVGALNVGHITCSKDQTFSEEIKHIQQVNSPTIKKEYPNGQSVGKGEELGIFHLGSTVVLFLDSAVYNNLKPNLKSLMPIKVKFGSEITIH